MYTHIKTSCMFYQHTSKCNTQCFNSMYTIPICQLYFNKTEKMQILPQVNIIVKFIVQTCSKSLHFSCKQKGSSNFIK